MAFNPSPEVAVARDAAKRLDAAAVIVLYVSADGKKLGLASYGRTKELCKRAGKIGDDLHAIAMGWEATAELGEMAGNQQ